MCEAIYVRGLSIYYLYIMYVYIYIYTHIGMYNIVHIYHAHIGIMSYIQTHTKIYT